MSVERLDLDNMEHAVLRFIDTNSRPLRVTLAASSAWFLTACLPGYLDQVTKNEAPPTGELGFKQPSSDQITDSLLITREFINPSYRGEESTIASSYTYFSETNNVKELVTEVALAWNGQEFVVRNRYSLEGKLNITFLSPFSLDKLPGLPVDESEETLTEDQLMEIGESIFNLPNVRWVVTGPGSGSRFNSSGIEERKTSWSKEVMGTGKDAKGRLYYAYVRDNTEAELIVIHTLL